MFAEETINLLKQLYQWLAVEPSDIDEAKYLLLKRFSEVQRLSMSQSDQADQNPDGFQHRKAFGGKACLRT